MQYYEIYPNNAWAYQLYNLELSPQEVKSVKVGVYAY